MTAEQTGDSAILVERAGSIATLTFNRPDQRNAIDDAMRAEFMTKFGELAVDRDIRVILLTGAGSAFCAGGDVRSMRKRLDADPSSVAIDGWHRQHRTAAMIALIHGASVITIAAVNGPAMGLGMDVALACDFIVAAPEAKFGATFVKRGLIPDGGSLYFLPRRVGLQKSKELIYSGRTVEIDEAESIGLVDRRAATGGLLEETAAFAAQFTENSAPAIAMMKAIVDTTFENSLSDIARLGGQAQSISYTTTEHRASVEAFLKPKA
ncbi:MAG: enoyl-CoA hydratase [Microbacteriaceae bacterium]|jgi:enoyl-CoA hydratase/carnithine racemase|nr:enoyl-CoA hydratase [Microbacteriaceae bacterium]